MLQATDELVSRGSRDLPHFSVRIASLAAYAKAHPETVLVDCLDKLQQVHSVHSGIVAARVLH